jgi:hypothetical protein
MKLNNVEMNYVSLFLPLKKLNDSSLKMSGQYFQALRDRRVELSIKGFNIHRAGSKNPLGWTILGMYLYTKGPKKRGMYNHRDVYYGRTDQERIIWERIITAPWMCSYL